MIRISVIAFLLLTFIAGAHQSINVSDHGCSREIVDALGEQPINRFKKQAIQNISVQRFPIFNRSPINVHIWSTSSRENVLPLRCG